MTESRPGAALDVAIVGAGAVAQALGRLMTAAGVPVVALVGRNRARAELAALFIGAGSGRPVVVVDLAQLPQIARRVLIAVGDHDITPVAEDLAAAGMTSGAALHTCGAKGPEALAALQAAGTACGVLHPLQTVMTPDQGVKSLPEATFAVAGEREAVEWGEEIAHMVTGARGRTLHIAADRLSYYHAGAVMASNALVAALDAAVELLGRAGVTRHDALRAIAPLARTSLNNALLSGPETAITGPVVRGDAATVASHVRAMADGDPTIARLYEAAATRLLHLARRRGLPADRVREVEAAIDGGGRRT